MHQALVKANASFVKELELGLDTYVGASSTTTLSGG